MRPTTQRLTSQTRAQLESTENWLKNVRSQCVYPMGTLLRRRRGINVVSSEIIPREKREQFDAIIQKASVQKVLFENILCETDLHKEQDHLSMVDTLKIDFSPREERGFQQT